ncbi:glycosyltransferase [Nonomuraea typhae]|uniref:glycosyltransferase n=1 Tax=Nonomuraea typhae TaxID=2603600 RepID=UPI0012F94CFC|nr:glycosyltransferase [Nonomuraea typhae]
MRVKGNDYRALEPPAVWTPALTVSVIIPAYGGQHRLDLVLQALARQTYPERLTEIIVVDNGSSPPLRLPADAPAGTTLLTCPAPGRAAARNTGLAHATGDVIHWLDSDVLLTPGAVEAHMRWHHRAAYLAVTGYIRFTDAPIPAELPDDLEKALEPAQPHAWIVDLVERTRGLTDNPQRPFSIHVGGATSVNARLIAAAGPMDEDLILGQDTEMGYRLAQAGAVFVPEPLARAYHLGPTMRMRDKAPIDRISHAYVADRIPAYRWLRSHPGRTWKVPYVAVLVDGTTGYETVRATVDTVLAGTIPDVSVTLTGPWQDLTPDRRHPLTDPNLDLALVHGHYRHDPRVRLAETEDVSPAIPWILRLPAGWAPAEDGLAKLLELARDEGLGLINILLSESPEGLVRARLERTASFARAALVTRPGEDLDDAVDDVSGVTWVEGDSYGFTTTPDIPLGRRSALRTRLDAQAETVRLAKETERLRGQVAKWRDEAGRWRKSAVELRREVGTLRRQLTAANRTQRGLRALLAASLKRAWTRKPG